MKTNSNETLKLLTAGEQSNLYLVKVMDESTKAFYSFWGILNYARRELHYIKKYNYSLIEENIVISNKIFKLEKILDNVFEDCYNIESMIKRTREIAILYTEIEKEIEKLDKLNESCEFIGQKIVNFGKVIVSKFKNKLVNLIK